MTRSLEGCLRIHSHDEERISLTGVKWCGPRTELEAALCALFSDLLGTSDVGIDDDFFELGGHSLLAFRFAQKAGEQIDRRLRAVALYDAPTVRQISNQIATVAEGPVDRA